MTTTRYRLSHGLTRLPGHEFHTGPSYYKVRIESFSRRWQGLEDALFSVCFLTGHRLEYSRLAAWLIARNDAATTTLLELEISTEQAAAIDPDFVERMEEVASYAEDD